MSIDKVETIEARAANGQRFGPTGLEAGCRYCTSSHFSNSSGIYFSIAGKLVVLVEGRARDMSAEGLSEGQVVAEKMPNPVEQPELVRGGRKTISPFERPSSGQNPERAQQKRSRAVDWSGSSSPCSPLILS